MFCNQYVYFHTNKYYVLVIHIPLAPPPPNIDEYNTQPQLWKKNNIYNLSLKSPPPNIWVRIQTIVPEIMRYHHFSICSCVYNFSQQGHFISLLATCMFPSVQSGDAASLWQKQYYGFESFPLFSKWRQGSYSKQEFIKIAGMPELSFMKDKVVRWRDNSIRDMIRILITQSVDIPLVYCSLCF